MTKAELIDKICTSLSNRNLTKSTCNELVDTLFCELATGIKKDKRFTYPGFGTWTVRARKARRGRNPQTGEEIKIKASKTVAFKPSLTYKASIQ